MEYVEFDVEKNACARCGHALGGDGAPIRVVLGTCALYHRACHEEVISELVASYGRLMLKVRGATWSGYSDMPQWAKGMIGDENVTGIEIMGGSAKIIRATNPRDPVVSGLADMEGFRTTFFVRQYEPTGASGVDYEEVIRGKNRVGGPTKCDHPTCSDVFATFVKGTGDKKSRLVVVVVKKGPPGAPSPDEAADKVAADILGKFAIMHGATTDYAGSRVSDGACYHWSTPEVGQWAVAADPSPSIFESQRPILAATTEPDAPLVFSGNERGLQFVPRMSTYYTRI